MSTTGAEPPQHLEETTSPLSSDAETEPLAYDETVPDADDMPLGTMPLENKTLGDSLPCKAERGPVPFASDSDLSDDPDVGSNTTPRRSSYVAPPAPARDRTPFSDDGSSLSEVVEEKHASLEPRSPMERSALDNLADLASSAADDAERQDDTPMPSDADDDEVRSQDMDVAGVDGDREDDADVVVQPRPENGAKRTQSLYRTAIAAAGKRRAAATGGAPSLLLEPEVDETPSAATSRQTSPAPASDLGEAPPKADPDDAEGHVDDSGVEDEVATDADGESDMPPDVAADADAVPGTDAAPAKDDAQDDASAAEPEGHADETAAGAVTAETVEADDGTFRHLHAAEAAQQRQAAMDALTRIEIGFAMLRERLYAERLFELERETEMIQQGTHPELRVLHTLIDTRKQRRLEVLDVWLEKSKAEMALRAEVEDRIAWDNWRHDAAQLRRTMMTDADRKRRKLEREKRQLDMPQPPRRHQVFEAEFVRKPPAYSRRTRQHPTQYAARDMTIHDARGFLAYPDVRGLEEYDRWMDMEQMGLRPPPPPPPGYGRPDDGPGPMDMYGAYPADAAGRMPYYAAPGYVDHGVVMGPAYDGMYMEPMEVRHGYDGLYDKPAYMPALPPLPPRDAYPDHGAMGRAAHGAPPHLMHA